METILAIGDSITAPLDGGSGFRGIAAQSLGPAYRWVGSQVDSGYLAHEGHAGFTAKQLLPFANAAGKFSPSIILILAGTNDLSQEHSPAEVLSDLHELVTAAKKSAPRARVFLGTLIPLPGADAKVNSINTAIRKVSPSWGASIVDYAAEVDPVYLVSGRTAILDGYVHPNRRGNELMARAAVKALRSNDARPSAGWYVAGAVGLGYLLYKAAQ